MTSGFEELGIACDVARAAQAIGICQPFHLQRRGIPAMLVEPRRDIFLTAPSKTGRTTSFILAILQSISSTENAVRAVLLMPHRELVWDTFRLFEDVANLLPVRAHGMGLSLRPGESSLRNDVQIICTNNIQVIISTPQQLAALVTSKSLGLSQVDMLVIDGADEILARDDANHIEAILKGLCNAHIQLVLSSAAPSPELHQLANSIMQDPVLIEEERKLCTKNLT